MTSIPSNVLRTAKFNPLGPLGVNPDGTASHLNRGTRLSLPFSPLGPLGVNPDGTVTHQGPTSFTPPPPVPFRPLMPKPPVCPPTTKMPVTSDCNFLPNTKLPVTSDCNFLP